MTEPATQPTQEPPDPRATAELVDRLLAQLRSAPDPRAAAAAEELVRGLVQLYGAGLARIVDLVGPARVAERTRELADRLKEGLAGIRGVRLVTPRAADLSAGVVCCEVPGVPVGEAVGRAGLAVGVRAGWPPVTISSMSRVKRAATSAMRSCVVHMNVRMPSSYAVSITRITASRS